MPRKTKTIKWGCKSPYGDALHYDNLSAYTVARNDSCVEKRGGPYEDRDSCQKDCRFSNNKGYWLSYGVNKRTRKRSNCPRLSETDCGSTDGCYFTKGKCRKDSRKKTTGRKKANEGKKRGKCLEYNKYFNPARKGYCEADVLCGYSAKSRRCYNRRGCAKHSTRKACATGGCHYTRNNKCVPQRKSNGTRKKGNNTNNTAQEGAHLEEL